MRMHLKIRANTSFTKEVISVPCLYSFNSFTDLSAGVGLTFVQNQSKAFSEFADMAHLKKTSKHFLTTFTYTEILPLVSARHTYIP